MNEMLKTFQIVSSNKVISPMLTTIRCYGDWMESIFDPYTVDMELYMKSVKQNGERVLERHPGTKIGKFFDGKQLSNPSLMCWFALKESPVVEKLVKLKMAEYKDTVPSSVNDSKHRQILRMYTTDQIEFYIRSVIDKSFRIASYCDTPKQVKLKETDMDTLIIPKIKASRTKSLF